MKKLEIYYLANKSENIYFALLGDCSSGPNKEEKYDKEIIEEGLKQTSNLNEKYLLEENKIPIFNFIYRKRTWNGKEETYLGWERKRGLLTEFNEYLLGNDDNRFKANTIEDWKKKNSIKEIPNIEYIITLDSDTELPLNTAFELVGAMAHVLNKPILNEKHDAVIDGYGIIQPRVGIDLNTSRKNLFTKIFVGGGGIDPYTNAISDVYQDNFGEGIFTGKGIYDLKVFSKVLKNEIPENKVLSHDLLEGSYLRCGLATDILLIDGYPTNYEAFKTRLHRWVRGDFQIAPWIKPNIIDKKEIKKKNPLNLLSRYKIFDNLIREISPILVVFIIVLSVLFSAISGKSLLLPLLVAILHSIIGVAIFIINILFFREEGIKYQKRFDSSIGLFNSYFIRTLINIGTLPDKAYLGLDAVIRTIYRMCISHKYLLQWTTAEEAEKNSKNDFKSYNKNMLPNIILGLLLILSVILMPLNNQNSIAIEIERLILLVIGIIWCITPVFMWYISQENNKRIKKEEITKKDRDYLNSIGELTFKYFKDLINEENNYLPPDNYQEDRKPITVSRTSSTNIGLGLLAIISGYDLGYESLHDTLDILNKMLSTIEKLSKWNGHLYNWYDTKTLEPLIPRYISTVDSGNFIAYVYVVKSFLLRAREEIKSNNELSEEERQKELLLIPYWVDMPISEIPIAKADFRELYDEEKRLFSIGYNIEEGKLTRKLL